MQVPETNRRDSAAQRLLAWTRCSSQAADPRSVRNRFPGIFRSDGCPWRIRPFALSRDLIRLVARTLVGPAGGSRAGSDNDPQLCIIESGPGVSTRRPNTPAANLATCDSCGVSCNHSGLCADPVESAGCNGRDSLLRLTERAFAIRPDNSGCGAATVESPR